METRFAVCAFDMPKKDFVLMRINSIRIRAMPVKIR